MSNQSLGKLGEHEAEKFLSKLGYKIVARNFRTRWGEIDIIAKEGGVWVFAEVKTRQNDRFGLPEEAVTRAKQEHLLAAAQIYLAQKRLHDAPWRVDVLALTKNADGFSVRHLPNAIVL